MCVARHVEIEYDPEKNADEYSVEAMIFRSLMRQFRHPKAS